MNSHPPFLGPATTENIATASNFPWTYFDLPQLPADRLHRVSSTAGFSVLNTYHVQPDNEAGTKVAYTKLLESVIAHNVGVQAEVWVTDLTSGADECLLSGLTAGPHSGADLSWASGNLLISKAADGYVVIDAESKSIVARMAYWANDYSPHNGHILGWGLDHDLSTIYVHDLARRSDRVLLTSRHLAPFAEHLRTDTRPETWTLSDTRWAPGGKRFSFHCSLGPLGKALRFLFIADADGSNIHFFAQDHWAEKPMHDGWYDDHSIFGHDDRHFNDVLRQRRPLSELTPDDFTLRVWDLDGRVTIPHLAPPGCHVSLSPDRQWAANESWYTTNPIDLNLWHTHSRRGCRILRTDLVPIVWNLRAHLNPVFSRNGQRLYFNKPVSDQVSEVWCADLEDL